MLLKQYDTDFFNIKPKKFKKGVGGVEAPEEETFNVSNDHLPKESDLKPTNIPDDFVHNYIFPAIGGFANYLGGEKSGRRAWDGVTGAVSSIQPSQRGELDDIGKAMYGTQEWVEVQNERQSASPEAKKAAGSASASHAEVVLTGAEAKRNDVYDAEHPASKWVLTPEGKADKTRKAVTGFGDSIVGFVGGDEGKKAVASLKKAGGIDAGIKYADQGIDVLNATLGSLFNFKVDKLEPIIEELHPTKAPQVRKRLKQDLGSGMNAFSKWR